jgi:hypothetical protein
LPPARPWCWMWIRLSEASTTLSQLEDTDRERRSDTADEEDARSAGTHNQLERSSAAAARPHSTLLKHMRGGAATAVEDGQNTSYY